MIKLAIFDLDKTIISTDSIFILIRKALIHKPMIIYKLLRFFVKHLVNIFNNISIDAKEEFFKIFLWWKLEEIEKLSMDVFGTIKRKYYRESIINELQKDQREHFVTILISASIENYVSLVAKDLGFDIFLGTRLVFENGLYTGKFYNKNCKGVEKISRLNAIIDFSKIDFKNSKAYSDHHSDLPLFLLVGKPHIVSPTKKLKIIACQKKWPIILR